jgi:hypothetical protein
MTVERLVSFSGHAHHPVNRSRARAPELSNARRPNHSEPVPLVYRERQDHTLQARALVDETYLRLVDPTRVESPSRAQFFAVAPNLMRQILVNHARHHRGSRSIGTGNGFKVFTLVNILK